MLSFQTIQNWDKTVRFGLIFLVGLTVISLIILAVLGITTFSSPLNTPDGSPIVAESSFEVYVGLVNDTQTFLTTLLGLVVTALMILLLLLVCVLMLWAQDRKRINQWKDRGLHIEDIELLSGERVRLNRHDIELNKTQYNTLKRLMERRAQGEALHPVDLPNENATQLIKRLREELGGKLMEQCLIRNRRGKGYWLEAEVDMAVESNKQTD